VLVTVFNKSSSRYETVPQGKALEHVRQPQASGLVDLHGRALSFREPLTATGSELAHDIGASFVLAENKTMARLEDKVVEDGGDGHQITDFVRGSIMINHWKQVEELCRRIDPAQNTGLIDVAGNTLVLFKDNFAEPLKNGMRRVMQKWDVSNDNQDHHICEIQARVGAMKAAEDLTHRIYTLQRDFTRKAIQLSATDAKLSQRLTILAQHCHDLIKPIHDLEAMRLGYDVLIATPYDPSTAPSPKNPVLKILMRDAQASAQLMPIFRMQGPALMP
jgi:hypothetical protein